MEIILGTTIILAALIAGTFLYRVKKEEEQTLPEEWVDLNEEIKNLPEPNIVVRIDYNGDADLILGDADDLGLIEFELYHEPEVNPGDKIIITKDGTEIEHLVLKREFWKMKQLSGVSGGLLVAAEVK